MDQYKAASAMVKILSAIAHPFWAVFVRHQQLLADIDYQAFAQNVSAD